jgi:DNA gyrase subunit B
MKKGKELKYVYSDDELKKALETMEGAEIQRYKGLGEMNPDQLWDTTMAPETRTLKQVTIEDAMDADELFSILMGVEVGPRREFIQSHAAEVKNLDV